MQDQLCLVVTGSAGRFGTLLRLLWPGLVGGALPVWFARVGGSGVVGWQIGVDPPAALPQGAVVLHLAATLRGDAAGLAANTAQTTAVCHAAQRAGARHVFFASTAAIYAPGPMDIPESDSPGPLTPYGAAKLAAEHAAEATLCGADGPGLTLLRIGNVAGADALLGRHGSMTPGPATLGPATLGPATLGPATWSPTTLGPATWSPATLGPMTLDPVPGLPAGPLRSYIGPHALAGVLAGLIERAAAGQALPRRLNVALPGVVAMGDLLTAAGRDWRFGPPRAGVVPRVGLATGLLTGLLPLPAATAQGITADLASLKGRWP